MVHDFENTTQYNNNMEVPTLKPGSNENETELV